MGYTGPMASASSNECSTTSGVIMPPIAPDRNRHGAPVAVSAAWRSAPG